MEHHFPDLVVLRSSIPTNQSNPARSGLRVLDSVGLGWHYAFAVVYRSSVQLVYVI